VCANGKARGPINDRALKTTIVKNHWRRAPGTEGAFRISATADGCCRLGAEPGVMSKRYKVYDPCSVFTAQEAAPGCSTRAVNVGLPLALSPRCEHRVRDPPCARLDEEEQSKRCSRRALALREMPQRKLVRAPAMP
jgi:hypothetical protein